MLKSVNAGIFIALAAAAPASATTYDAYSSFNGTNPAGSFQYLSNGVPLAAPAGDCVSGLTGLTCLQTATGSNGPGFYKSQADLTLSTEGGTNNVHIDSTKLSVAPGAGVFFIAPSDGTYSIYALFSAEDDLANGITINAVQRLSGAVSASLVGGANGVPSGLIFTKTITLAAGDLFGFSINPGQTDSHDLTGFTFIVTDAVPEPATWAMMLLGLGGIGLASRRRKRNESQPEAA